MMRIIFALAAFLYASSIFAKEEIDIYTSYRNDEEKSVSHKMKCQDSRCIVRSDTAERSIALKKIQRDQILKAFQAEAKRFDIQSVPKSGDRLIKIKFRYSTNGKRLNITQRLPADQLSELSPELTAVIETYFAGLDLSSLGAPVSDTGDKETEQPAR